MYPPSQTSRRSSVVPPPSQSAVRNGPPLINKKSTKALLESFVMLKENIVDLETDVNHVLSAVDKARGPAALKMFTSSLDTLQNTLAIRNTSRYDEAQTEQDERSETAQ